jgi:predicted GH43/DUF377 family glycosyl hydrolase
MKLKRHKHNPIVAPVAKSTWENICTCNPAAWFDGRKVWLLYRGGPDTDRHPIYLGLAESNDGFTFRRVSDQPVFGPSDNGFDGGCIEDPRIVKFGDTYFVTYAARMFPPAAYWRKKFPLNAFNPPLPVDAPVAARENLTRSGLAATKDFRTWHRLGPITSADLDDRDVILFPERVNGQFVMLHRPSTWVGPDYGCERPSIWMSFSRDLLCWREEHLLAQPAFDWERGKIGGSTPPIKTEAGWLTLYHGVDENMVYRVGAMLLDAGDPTKIIGRTPQPILEPEAECERVGLVPNVVFPCGNVLIGDELFVYYGAADKYCCVATCRLKELIDYTLANPARNSLSRPAVRKMV